MTEHIFLQMFFMWTQLLCELFVELDYFEANSLFYPWNIWNSHCGQICMVKRIGAWKTCFAVFGQSKLTVFNSKHPGVANLSNFAILRFFSQFFQLNFLGERIKRWVKFLQTSAQPGRKIGSVRMTRPVKVNYFPFRISPLKSVSPGFELNLNY